LAFPSDSAKLLLFSAFSNFEADCLVLVRPYLDDLLSQHPENATNFASRILQVLLDRFSRQPSLLNSNNELFETFVKALNSSDKTVMMLGLDAVARAMNSSELSHEKKKACFDLFCKEVFAGQVEIKEKAMKVIATVPIDAQFLIPYLEVPVQKSSATPNKKKRLTQDNTR
jgi:hypothetical protein